MVQEDSRTHDGVNPRLAALHSDTAVAVERNQDSVRLIYIAVMGDPYPRTTQSGLNCPDTQEIASIDAVHCVYWPLPGYC